MRTIIAVLVVSLLVPAASFAQAGRESAAWRDVAERAGAGAAVKVRLADGTSFRGTLLRAESDAVLVQPRTRVPVPVQSVPYDAIASFEQEKRGGASTAKAIAIGVGAGVASFWAMAAIMIALVGD